ncbi:hypothetical protein J5N97_008781 [Dioscorea zingiberensis]|uniref:SRR1-like domain-containing protein n=1 Tax=Dioscorea zingiberensis TaxID=325984 RepID=A0A9D5CVL2_9LILI|nr:hypothetical protein J5N97_008781 [Dioscorea zingiberensis]
MELEGDNHEYNTLMEGIKYAVEEVRGSDLYNYLVDKIDQAKVPEMINVPDYLGGHAMPMVIYGLGSIQYSYAARFQLAFAVLLREVTGLKIDRDRVTICCDDITLNPIEEAFKAYGCKVVVVPEGRRFRWMVDEPTLFFLPFTRIEVLGDLLETNWCPSRLKRMMFLGRSLRSMAKILDPMVSTSTCDGGRSKMNVRKLTYVRDRLRYIWGIKEHSREFKIGDIISPINSKSQLGYSPQEMFEDMCWHVFSFDENINTIEDMDTLLPSKAGL